MRRSGSGTRYHWRRRGRIQRLNQSSRSSPGAPFGRQAIAENRARDEPDDSALMKILPTVRSRSGRSTPPRSDTRSSVAALFSNEVCDMIAGEHFGPEPISLKTKGPRVPVLRSRARGNREYEAKPWQSADRKTHTWHRAEALHGNRWAGPRAA